MSVFLDNTEVYALLFHGHGHILVFLLVYNSKITSFGWRPVGALFTVAQLWRVESGTDRFCSWALDPHKPAQTSITLPFSISGVIF